MNENNSYRELVSMRNYGEVLRHFCPAESPIETMACTSDSQKLIIGQVATDENIPTLSIIDIESGKTLRIIEESDNYENSIWKLVIDKNDMNIVYLKQIHNRFYIITYNMKIGRA